MIANFLRLILGIMGIFKYRKHGLSGNIYDEPYKDNSCEIPYMVYVIYRECFKEKIKLKIIIKTKLRSWVANRAAESDGKNSDSDSSILKIYDSDSSPPKTSDSGDSDSFYINLNRKKSDSDSSIFKSLTPTPTPQF